MTVVEIRLTWLVLAESTAQSGIVLDSWTIQLFILSLRLRSTEREKNKIKSQVNVKRCIYCKKPFFENKPCVENLIILH